MWGCKVIFVAVILSQCSVTTGPPLSSSWWVCGISLSFTTGATTDIIVIFEL